MSTRWSRAGGLGAQPLFNSPSTPRSVCVARACEPRLGICQIECIVHRIGGRSAIAIARHRVPPPSQEQDRLAHREVCESLPLGGALGGGTCFLNQPTPPPAARTPGHNLSALSTAPRLQLRTASSTTDTPRPGRPTTKARHATLATVCAARVSGQVDASAAGKSAVDEPAESREEWRAIEPRKGSYWRSLSSLSRPSAVTRQAICCAWSPKTGTPRLGTSKKRKLAAAQQVTEEV